MCYLFTVAQWLTDLVLSKDMESGRFEDLGAPFCAATGVLGEFSKGKTARFFVVNKFGYCC